MPQRFEPGQHVQRLAVLIEQRHLVDGQAHDHLGTCLQDEDQLAAETVAEIRHDDVADLPAKEGGPSAVCWSLTLTSSRRPASRS